jgi:hypothetical protein
VRRHLRGPRSPVVALGVAVAAVTAYVLSIAYDATAYLNDEYGTVMAGRTMAHDAGEVVSASAAGLHRGPERLTSIVLAIPDAVMGSTPWEMGAGHLALALAYALVAVPAYALMRGLDVPRWPAAGLAAAAIAGPWMVFGTTMLNVALAAPLTILFAWAAWRAVVRPSVGAEALVVGVAALMTTARASHAAFFGAAVLAAVAAAWWTREAGEGLVRLPRRVFARTPVIAAVALLGVAAVVVLGPERFAGDAYDQSASIRFPLGQIWDSLAWTTAALAIATGFVALPIGGAWALRELVRPADVRTGSFAVIALAIVLLYVYVAGAAGAEQQERYPAVLAALPIVALGAALFRRGEAWVLGTAVLGLVAARAIATRAVTDAADPLSYFFEPAQLFFSKVVVGRLTVALPGDEHMVTIATVGAAATAVLVTACLAPQHERAWHRNIKVPGTVPGTTGGTVPGTVVLVVLVFGAVSGVYTLRKYEPALGPDSLSQVAWLDRAGGGENVVFWNYQWHVNKPDRDVRARLTLYHNASACCGEWRPELADSVGGDGTIERDPVPRYVAGPDGYRPLVFEAVQTSRPTAYGNPFRVERFAGDHPRAAAEVVGAGVDGAVEDEPAEIVAYPALRGHCLDVTVTNRAEASGPIGYEVGDRRGRLRPGGLRVVRVPGAVPVRRTGDVDAPLVLGEIHYVECDGPESR